MNIKELLHHRILVLDGAMGTMIQRYQLSENDFRGDRFMGMPGTMKGNNDMLVLTQPNIIREIHESYLAAGADIIETNTFNATSISMEEYHLQDYVAEINVAAARLARQAADKFNKLTPTKPRFVAGSVGPTNKTTSMSPDVNNPAFRALTFDQLSEAYQEQIESLLEGGVDLILIETIFDTLNAKAAIYAAKQAMCNIQREVPIMLSVTISDIGGHTLSGQTLDAFIASVMHSEILSIGLNCSFGAKDMKPFLRELAKTAPYYISAYPNAGLPNRFGEYDETPATMLEQVEEFLEEGLINIIGGCCGTTPDHISAIVSSVKKFTPHKIAPNIDQTLLSGLEMLTILPENNFINIGERCNVAGSRKFLRLIKEKKYDEALQIARQQVEDGAQIIDINMDDAMLETREEMVLFLNLIASDPDVCKVPLMIDSSRFEVIESGLKCIQGKSVVNSISLKEGEEMFLKYAQKIKDLGAAVVVMAFDEKGQADTFDRRIEICSRAYKLLVEKADFNPNDIIFDPNILAIATGIREHDNYSVDFIEATKWIKENLPGAKVSGGVSNLSFSFRGNNYIREAMHAVFLYHAINAGMDMGIVNPATSVVYDDIPKDLLKLVEDVVLNRNPDATELLIEKAEAIKENQDTIKTVEKVAENLQSVDDRLIWALRKGNPSNLENDINEALTKYDKAIDIIDGPLMAGMNQVGILFGEGKMFLPQIVKTARTMKKAVELLQPVIEAQKQNETDSTSAGKYLLATVKGDVHDIGKNIVSVILACNNFEVIDLGVMVPAEEIVKTAIEQKVDFIGLSGLITPSLEEMCRVATTMENAGLTIPLMIGGATTSELHTAVKIAPNYRGPVFHLKDAARNPLLAALLLQPDTREQAIAQLQAEQEALRESIKEKKSLISFNEAIEKRVQIDWSNYNVPHPAYPGIHVLHEIRIDEIRDYINWTYFFHTWKLGGAFSQIANIAGCDACKASWLASFPQEERKKAAEAMQLFKDANRMLDKLDQELGVVLSAKFGFFPANADALAIELKTKDGIVSIPMLRQQQIIENKSAYKSLADFILPKEKQPVHDYIGAFVVKVGECFAHILERYKNAGDDYKSILLQSIGDRLVEAASEWLHNRVRKEYWGYAAEEKTSISEIKKGKYKGIRPAVGYPSLPDQSLNFVLEKLLDFREIGVSLTEHGAMYPHASVSGFYFAHPESNYFLIGPIDDEQKQLYISKREFSEKDSNKYLP
ncbi:MAG: methionine synthase [Bacteroidales bacterium]